MASILSAALLLDISLGLQEESKKIIQAVEQTLAEGYRTKDIADSKTPPEYILGTTAMGQKIVDKI